MTQQRLSNSTINRIIDESRKIQRGIIVWIGIMIVSIFVLVNPANRDTLIIYAGSATAIIVSISAIVMSALRIRGLDNHKPSVTFETVGDVNNDGDASDTLNFPATHTPTDARIEVTDGNTIRLGKHTPDYGTWEDLAMALHRNHWEWSRDRALKESGCFKNLTSLYPELTVDMINIGIVEGRRNDYRVSPKGQTFFIGQAADLFLEHMIA